MTKKNKPEQLWGVYSPKHIHGVIYDNSWDAIDVGLDYIGPVVDKMKQRGGAMKFVDAKGDWIQIYKITINEEIKND